MKRDCLGRNCGASIADMRKTRLLTDDELTIIAHDARTQPPAEAARHLFPLIQHIGVLDDRCCEQCRFWVRHNNAHSAIGECTRPSTDDVGVRLQVVSAAGERLAVDTASPALIVPFDWHCKGWEVQAVCDEAQAAIGAS